MSNVADLRDRPGQLPDRLPPSSMAAQRSPSATVMRGALAILSTQPLTWAVGLLMVVFVPRYLSDHDIGRIAVANTISTLSGTILMLGLSTSMTRRIARDSDRASVDATAVLVLLLGLSIPVAIGLACAGPLLGFASDADAILPITLAIMVIGVPQTILGSVLVGQQRHAWYAWTNCASVVGTALGGIAVLAAGGPVSLFVAVGGLAMVVVAGLGWYLSGIGLRREGLSLWYMRDLVREGLPFLGGSIATRIRGDAEIGLLAALVSQQVVGWWGAAVRIIGIPIFAPMLLTTPLLPALSRSLDDRYAFQRTLQRSLTLTLLMTVPSSTLIAVLAPTIPTLLGWHEGFQNASPLIVILSLQVPLIAVGMVLGTALVALGDERRLLGINLLTTVVSIGLMLLAIPMFTVWLNNGAIGAAVSRILCELVMVGGALVLLPNGTVEWATVWTAGRIVIAAVCLVVVAELLLSTSIILAVGAAGLAFLAAGFVLGILRLDDVETIRTELMDSLARRRVREAA